MGLDRVSAKNIVPAVTQTVGNGFIIQHNNAPKVLVTISGFMNYRDSDATTAIADGVTIGQELTIVLVDVGTNNTMTILDNANTKLQGNWTRNANESWLKVVWDGSDWIQVGANDGINNTITGAEAHADGRSNTASGQYSHAENFSNTASGQYSHAGGSSSSASGAYCFAHGRDVIASLYAEHAHSAGDFAADGDAQFSRVLMRHATTNATLSELYLDDSAARLTILDEYTYACKILVVGRQNTGVDHFMGLYHVLIQRTGGTVALVGTVDIIYENNAGGLGAGGGLPVAITADNTNKTLKIAVEGLASHSIRWVATVEMVRIGYSD